MFSNVGTFVKGKLAERAEEKEKEKEYEKELKEERYKARRANIPKIAQMEAAEDLKAVRSGKAVKSGGIGGAIQNYAAGFGNTGYGQSVGFGKGGGTDFNMPKMDFGLGDFGASKPRKSRSHRKGKKR